jgi:ubiquinol-cytochrome c reductase iron-sulfur subunit|nr:ubiquinol-cytochrome c reductase iron-sulfur subunit [Afipia birgiae]
MHAPSTGAISSTRSPTRRGSRRGYDEWLVVIGICPHLGCIPLAHQRDYGAWFCPRHGSQYDTAGRARRGPAPTNLDLPAYSFLSDNKIRIG